MKRSPILWLMLLAMATIGVLAYLDEERESAAALADFTQEQATLGRSLAAALGARLAGAHHDALAVVQSHTARQLPLPAIVERYLSVVVRAADAPPGPPPPPSQRAVRLSFPGPEGEAVDLTVSFATLL